MPQLLVKLPPPNIARRRPLPPRVFRGLGRVCSGPRRSRVLPAINSPTWRAAPAGALRLRGGALRLSGDRVGWGGLGWGGRDSYTISIGLLNLAPRWRPFEA